MKYSQRTAWSFTDDRLEAAAARTPGLIDLTVSNPTRVGLPPALALLDSLSDPLSLSYDPHPFGAPAAREALAVRYGVDAANICLTASTSEAYSHLFRLLCDPGDRVLVPVPSYPLFEVLAGLENVAVDTCPTHAHDDFALDVAALEASLTDRSRAIILVSPNNPTGRVLRRAELEAVGELCRRRSLALIVDEVFADWIARPSPEHASAVGFERCLTFVLGGLSKSLLLPQMKLAWTLVQGPRAEVDEALARLEMIADAALSVSGPVQQALPSWLEQAEAIRAPLLARLARNRQSVATQVKDSAVTLWPSDGGWCALLRVPRTRTEEAWAVTLIEEAKVRVAPGYFFDFPEPGWLVISLLPEEALFEEAVRRLVLCVR